MQQRRSIPSSSTARSTPSPSGTSAARPTRSSPRPGPLGRSFRPSS